MPTRLYVGSFEDEADPGGPYVVLVAARGDTAERLGPQKKVKSLNQLSPIGESLLIRRIPTDPIHESEAFELNSFVEPTLVGLAGVVNRDRLRPLYIGATDALLLPGRTIEGKFEGLGLVFAEAASQDCLSTGSRIGGLEDAASDDRFLFNETDQDACTHHLAALLEGAQGTASNSMRDTYSPISLGGLRQAYIWAWLA